MISTVCVHYKKNAPFKWKICYAAEGEERYEDKERFVVLLTTERYLVLDEWGGA